MGPETENVVLASRTLQILHSKLYILLATSLTFRSMGKNGSHDHSTLVPLSFRLSKLCKTVHSGRRSNRDKNYTVSYMVR